MLLDELKQRTRSHHERLEQLNGMPATRGDYIALLESFYGFVAPWEQKLAAAAEPADPAWQGRAKSGWLEADLAHFGCSAEERANLPRCLRLPATTSRAERLGACYVLEGATLGGQFISRHLENTLGLAAGEGYRFFRSYGADVGAKWQAFRQELLQHSSPENDPVMIQAAQDTFEMLTQWFEARRAVAA